MCGKLAWSCPWEREEKARLLCLLSHSVVSAARHGFPSTREKRPVKPLAQLCISAPGLSLACQRLRLTHAPSLPCPVCMMLLRVLQLVGPGALASGCCSPSLCPAALYRDPRRLSSISKSLQHKFLRRGRRSP